MSLFSTVEIPCPACGTKVPFEAVNSVNAVARPDLRDAIRQGTFQKQACRSCGKEFRMDPRFSFIDTKRGQWIAVFPEPDLAEWRVREEEVERLFDKAWGGGAPALAREIGDTLRPRLVFGWPALLEKLALEEAKLDDIQVELLKIGLLRNMPETPYSVATELRFVGAPDDGTGELAFAWIDSTTAEFVQGLRVPRELYDDVAEDPAWQGLRSELTGSRFVDMKRLLTPAPG